MATIPQNLAFEQVKEVTDRLYAIVHFAGIYMLDSLVEMDSESFRRIFDVNFYGVFLVNKAFPNPIENSLILNFNIFPAVQ